MGIRNLGWAASNEGRFYPVDDSATFLDDASQRPPLQILADAKILVPDGIGKFVYVGAVSVTPYIVSVIFMASDSQDSPGGIIASVSQSLPLTRHYPYQISSQVSGVCGWVSFGNLDGLSYRGAFSQPSQSLLSPLAARWYRGQPVESVKSSGGQSMTGLVKLVGGNDIEIVRECREIPGQPLAPYLSGYCGGSSREVIVVRLKNKSNDETLNVYDTYSGPCSARPSSKTCGDPQPIEFIGPISPDCDGNITINIAGCLDVMAVRLLFSVYDYHDPVYSDASRGVILNCGLELADTCASDRLPDSAGNLPSEFDEFPEESVSSISESVSEERAPPFGFDGGAAAGEATSDFSEDFMTEGEYNSSWVIHFGNMNYMEGELVAGPYSRNVVAYEPGSPNRFYKTAQSRVMLQGEPAGALHNAAVIANYKSGTYYVAEIDWDGHFRGKKLFRIAKFSGAKWTTITSTPIQTLQIGKTYDLSISVSPHTDGLGAWLSASLVGVSDPSINVSLPEAFVSDYGGSPGCFGIGSNRSATRFLNFKIINLLTSP